MLNRDYYKQQITPILESIKNDATYKPQIKIYHDGKSTNFLSVTPEKLQKIFEILTGNESLKSGGKNE